MNVLGFTGLGLMEALVDEVRINKNARGTALRLIHGGAQASASSRDET